MENNVEVAVRVCPIFYDNDNELCVSPNIYNNSVHLCNSINSHVFPVNYALPLDCNQNALFATTVTPLLNYFLEGCDVSVVGYGQTGSGKSYTLLGPALSCALSECEYGIIPRFLRELFGLVGQKKDKNYVVHVTWSQICGENVQDLLGVGSVQCGNVGQAFEVLQLGMSNLSSQSVHTLFTVTLEQNWVVETVVQHKISTASFVDLASSKTMYLMNNNGITETVLSDSGLNMLQKCVWALSESGVAPYNQSALTMLLKDSFGGRAKTLVICCVTPLFCDFMETFYTLEFARRSQMVKNFVTINSYTTYENSCDNTDVFGLQFAANQLLQLVSNAESLFNNLILNGSLSKSQMQQISKWLTLKQECDDCISETSEHPRSLDIIKEEMEGSQDNSSSEESECVEQEEPQNMQQLEDLMQSFKSKTDGLVSENNRKHVTIVKTKSNESSYNEFHAKGARGRRASIHNQTEKMSPLHLISSKSTDDSFKSNTKVSELSYEGKLKMLQQTCDEIARCESQINQLELTVATKEKFVQQLLTYKSQNSSTRDKLKKNYNKLRTEESKARSKLMHAKSVNDQEMERKYYGEVCRITQKLSESEFIKDVTKDDVKKIGELESSLNNSKKELQQLKKQKEKEEKQKQSFEIELDKCKRSSDSDVGGSKKNNLSLVLAARSVGTESSEMFKYDIKELRKTRDLLLQQRYSMDAKANKKLLHESEELKIFRCEEAIEIVDLSIEYKNQLLCGTIVVLDESILDKQENVEKILIEQLLKFNTNEIRVLLKRYFEKVIDLRSSTKRLEYQLSEMEVQNENLLYRIQNLTHALQRVRLESERRIVSLKQQHEDKLQLVIRRFIPDDNDDDDGGSERVMSRVVKTSKQAALAFQVAQTSNGKQMDKKSLIAKVTRYARHEIVPRQLQAAITQATVTRQKNKLIIQQSNK